MNMTSPPSSPSTSFITSRWAYRAVVRAVGVVLSLMQVGLYYLWPGSRRAGRRACSHSNGEPVAPFGLAPFIHSIISPDFSAHGFVQLQQYVGIARLGLVRMVQQGGDAFDMVGLQKRS